ncbi:Mannose-1-phosphate guanylyltransferase rfbM [Candidatus Ornithobacterium hominis]|uniref:mannose-1-phosphate guanylyltransferase n=1 Tax=Candidatus Ornithobacterium hominis TaxID=2497989 RepID=A0A383TWH9_9FLAO|nr:mannose-1-phosphate guanylyltransferase [Candidatus Ornithobacterium hominis]SZD71261.1 Mannose-1-phosphate guanylyltransferase rfbM [Candidatus Ornithobacterium hominis]SZD71938.1 Mannose-1-phosphate guanylyltransferase rfbM [Candidatus Ornithobacterium hominis]
MMIKSQDIYCVIMAGGVGSRFWPMSTTKSPKQFHDVLGVGKTLIQQTYERLLKITSSDKIFVITDQDYVNLTQDQLPAIDRKQIIAEPFGMNTAPCSLYSAFKIKQLDENATLLICPSDHLILDTDDFVKDAKLGLASAQANDFLYTLGINPTRPDTGYGYIQFIENGEKIKSVKTFTEKPNLNMAKKFMQSGDFLWNSGIFIWKVSSILKAFKNFLPDMYSSFLSIEDKMNREDEFEQVKRVYPTLHKISIDVGILEKAKNVKVIKSNFGWSDLGTWDALYERGMKDDKKNVTFGEHVFFYNSQGNMIFAEKNKAVVIDGLEDYIVVDTANGLLITPLNKTQEVKTYVNDLRLNKKNNFL